MQQIQCKATPYVCHRVKDVGAGCPGGRWPCYYNSTCLSTSGTGAPACFAVQLYRESCKKFLTTYNNQVMFDIRYKHNIFCMPCLICQENISQISRNYSISLRNCICIYVQPHDYHGHCSHADHRPWWHW